jgi:dTDP-L-rhamnose 4-epimerase
MKNILITGGAGFIGSNLALKLLSKGYQVRVIDNLSKQIHGENAAETSPLYQSIIDKVDFIKGDVTIEEDISKAIKGQDAIIHLAAETGTGQSMYEIKKYCDVPKTFRKKSRHCFVSRYIRGGPIQMCNTWPCLSRI